MYILCEDLDHIHEGFTALSESHREVLTRSNEMVRRIGTHAPNPSRYRQYQSKITRSVRSSAFVES
jgi:hypothetical protein